MMIRIEQITETETEILINKINKEKADLPSSLFFIIILLIFLIFLPGRQRRPSFYSQFGFWKPAIIMTLLGCGITYYRYSTTIKNLQMDLDSQEKIVEEKEVWNKDKSFAKSEYRIWIDSNIKEFQKFSVVYEEYEQIEKGQKVVLEYGKMSHTLYNINFNIEIK